MTSETQTPQPTNIKRMYYGLGTLALMGVAAAILGGMNTATILISPHQGQDDPWMAVAGIGGLFALGGFWWVFEGASVWRRIGASLAFGFVGFIVSILLIAFGGDVIASYRDFPSGQTIRYTGVLHLSRAYYSHGKSPHGHVQTAQLWADFDVSDADYDFLRAHRSPEEVSHDAKGDEIPSKGRFCIRVELEQAGGHSLRVLHAGTRDLPDGSVILCPPNTPDPPDQFMRAWTEAHTPKLRPVPPEFMAAYKRLNTVSDGLHALDAASQR
ncbi:hypothetical protein FHW96_001563 [Novosphingobium sp. SG751A]|uniref:hypothetical protein n=1 Tax=Novosphingobium sp. SG751A TaxID=2587000 RepID=UPI00155483A1|nr:hypothetical protein [Novosphingobium sp. SG751A]NOW45408.1 hypothetical protein [Novosphingobium sp. SG751A]